MIDWHSHILPGVDDGSRDVQESLSLLQMLSAQGVDTVAATPHFYADDQTLEQFLERRQTAYETLQAALPEGAPRILLGAEVHYYPGISHMTDLERLALGGSSLLLLEMSMDTWGEYTVRELVELSGQGQVTVMLAHVERYMKMQRPETWERLYDCGLLMQVNATFFVGRFTRGKALRMLGDQRIHCIGSDCHHVTVRPPYLGTAYGIIRKKYGDGFIDQMDQYGRTMIAPPAEESEQTSNTRIHPL